MCLALGKKRKTSEELSDLKEIALGLYEDHPRLEIASKNRNSATLEYDDHKSLDTQIEQLEGTASPFVSFGRSVLFAPPGDIL